MKLMGLMLAVVVLICNPLPAFGATITSTIDPGPVGVHLFKTAIFDVSTDFQNVEANGEMLEWRINILPPKHLEFERFAQESMSVQATVAFDGSVVLPGSTAINARLTDPLSPDVVATSTFFIPAGDNITLAHAEWELDHTQFHSIHFSFPLATSRGTPLPQVFSAGVFLFGNDLNFSVGEWQTVPEPRAGASLLGLGVVAVCLGRRRNGRATDNHGQNALSRTF